MNNGRLKICVGLAVVILVPWVILVLPRLFKLH